MNVYRIKHERLQDKHERLQDKHERLWGNPFITALNPRIAIRKTQIFGFNMNIYRMKYEHLG